MSTSTTQRSRGGAKSISNGDVVMTDANTQDAPITLFFTPAAAAASTASARPHRAAASAAITQIHRQQNEQDRGDGEEDDEEMKTAAQPTQQAISSKRKRANPAAVAALTKGAPAAKKSRRDDDEAASEAESDEDEQPVHLSGSLTESDDDEDKEQSHRGKKKSSASQRKKGKAATTKKGKSSAAAAASSSPSIQFAPPISLMELLSLSGATFEQKVGMLSLTLQYIDGNNRKIKDERKKQHFDVRLTHPVTGDTFPMVVYPLLTSTAVQRKEIRPLKPFLDGLLDLIAAHADLVAMNAKGQTLLDIVSSKDSYKHVHECALRPHEQDEERKLALQEGRQQKYTRRFVSYELQNPSIIKRLIDASVTALTAQGQLNGGWTLPLAEMTADDLLPFRHFLPILCNARLVDKAELCETDASGNTPFHLLCIERKKAYRDPPAFLVAAAILKHRRLLVEVPIFAQNSQGETIIDLIEKSAVKYYGKLEEEEKRENRWETPIMRQQRVDRYRAGRNSAINVETAWLSLHQKKIVDMLKRHIISDLATVIFDCLAGRRGVSHQQAEKEELLEHEQTLEAAHFADEEEKSEVPSSSGGGAASMDISDDDGYADF